MQSRWSAFFLGFRRTFPFIGGVVPFGVLYATIATSAGFPVWITVLFSVVVFGGSSQLVFIDLFQSLGSPFQSVLGSNIVNARHLIYSAGVSEQFAPYPARWKWILSYLLTDQLYAISQSSDRQLSSMASRVHPWFYFGAGACIWSFWVLATVLGTIFGSFVPASWNLGFSIPLMFMPLVFMVSKDRYAYMAAIFSALFVSLLRGMPFGLGVFLAIIAASGTSVLLRRFLAGRGRNV